MVQINLVSNQESVQFSSVTQSCLTLCDPTDCSMQGLPVHHKLLEFIQTRVHGVGDRLKVRNRDTDVENRRIDRVSTGSTEQGSLGARETHG